MQNQADRLVRPKNHRMRSNSKGDNSGAGMSDEHEIERNERAEELRGMDKEDETEEVEEQESSGEKEDEDAEQEGEEKAGAVRGAQRKYLGSGSGSEKAREERQMGKEGEGERNEREGGRGIGSEGEREAREKRAKMKGSDPRVAIEVAPRRPRPGGASGP